jgi:allene oxide cyclase-like protein
MLVFARPFAPLRRGPIVLIAIVVAAAAAVVVLSSASAQTPAARTLTFKELEKGSTFTHIRNTKTTSRRANSQGDVMAFTNPLADAAGKRIGTTSAACTTTVGSRSFPKSTITCVGTVELPDGRLFLQAEFRLDATTLTGAVTGGTGAYANARGIFTNTGSVDTITLVG